MSISLVREFTEKLRPPRALWVPFPFGRPLGAPAKQRVQRRVIEAALSLLERPAGPVLAEYLLDSDEEYLDAKYQTIGRKCGPKGCSFDAEDDDVAASPSSASADEVPYDGDFTRIKAEIRELADAHRRYREGRGGRTAVGSSGVTPERIMEAAEVVHQCAVGGPIPQRHGQKKISSAERPDVFIRLSIDDMKAFYMEAWVETNGGREFYATEFNDWLWLKTLTGRMIISARDQLIAMTDSEKDPNWIIARAIVPRGYGESGYTLGHVIKSAGDSTEGK